MHTAQAAALAHAATAVRDLQLKQEAAAADAERQAAGAVRLQQQVQELQQQQQPSQAAPAEPQTLPSAEGVAWQCSASSGLGTGTCLRD